MARKDKAFIPARIGRLAEVAAKGERTILGLMSGTSLDGLDLALCRIRGHGAQTEAVVLAFETRPYTEGEKERLREVVFREQVSLAALTRLNGWLAELHARAVLDALQRWGRRAGEVDCLASHGQTVYHAPADGTGDPGHNDAHATLQIGDGDRLAVRTGILTLSDFRQKEIALGGQGAPLAPYAEALLYAEPGRSRVLVNIGGIANFTWLPPDADAAHWVSADSGPGNTLIDLAVRRWFPDRPDGFDRDGHLAEAGVVHRTLLRALMSHPYFATPAPKSTGPETFGAGYLDEALTALGGVEPAGQNIIATLTRLTAETLAQAIRREVPELSSTEVILTGGGAHNPVLTQWIRELLRGAVFLEGKILGVPPDAKEAVLFAVLANETLAGHGFPRRTVATDPLGYGFGKLSFPE